MAGNGPPPSAVAKFKEFTSADEETAITYLKTRGNDADAAIAAYFGISDRNEVDSSQRAGGYDESAFAADRHGGYAEGANIPAFQINGGTEGYLNASTAPSRPPSRVSRNRSDSMITIQPSENEFSGGTTTQETGVTETSVRYFGPATRSHYDPSSWALSVAGTTAHEIVPDLEAPARVIAEDQPAFMKPLPSGDYLPALITILHAIPAAREALLFRDHVSADYGYDPGWWNGTPILTSEVVADNITSNEDQGLQLIHETQRVMALLDQTNRSYGSVEALSKLEPVGDSNPETKTLVDKFLVGWEAAASRLSQSENIPSLFRSTALRTSPDESEMTHFWCFENILESDSRTSRTLYDAMDDAIWALDPLGNNNENTSIEQVAKVFVMRLIQQDANSTGLCVQIPPSWYVDRYLPENANAAKAMRVEMAKFKAQIAQIEAEEAKLRTFRHANTGKDFDVATLLRVVISHFTKAAESGEETGVDAEKLAEQLKLVQEHIAGKLQALEIEKSKVVQACETTCDLLKWSSSSSPAPRHKYHLRGVSTEPHVTYVLRDEESFGQDSAWYRQWWKLEYTNEPRVTKTRVSEIEVLRSAEEDSKEVMVIYAAEDALLVEQSDLPQPLLDFVTKDNASFDEELKEHERIKHMEFNSNWEDWPTEQPPAYEGSWAPAEEDARSKTIQEMTTADTQVQMVSSGGNDAVASDSDSIVDVVTVDNTPSPKSDGKAEHVEFADR